MGSLLSVSFSNIYVVKLENDILWPLKPKFTGDMLMICLTEEKLARITFFLNDRIITIQRLN